jgi:hypothetical protein
VSFLLDTNVVSEVRRKQPDPLVLSWLENVDPGALHISVLTLGEIAKGAAKRAARERLQADALDRWLQSIRLHYADRVVGIDATIAERWGRLTAVRTLPVIDGLLAATALVHNMTLVTRNVRDMADTGVAIHDPWTSQLPQGNP